MATREQVSVDLDTEVTAILPKHASDAHATDGEIIDRAVRAYDLRALLRRLHAASELDDDQAIALAREELKAARPARRADVDFAPVANANVARSLLGAGSVNGEQRRAGRVPNQRLGVDRSQTRPRPHLAWLMS
jgi:hypothetical protein